MCIRDRVWILWSLLIISFNIIPVASGCEEIHLYSGMNIDNVKINTSLIMMKECVILYTLCKIKPSVQNVTLCVKHMLCNIKVVSFTYPLENFIDWSILHNQRLSTSAGYYVPFFPTLDAGQDNHIHWVFHTCNREVEVHAGVQVLPSVWIIMIKEISAICFCNR